MSLSPSQLKNSRKHAEQRRIYMRTYYNKHKDKQKIKVKERRLKAIEMDGYSACVILDKHDEDLKDDPNRLSREFMKKLIGCKCADEVMK